MANKKDTSGGSSNKVVINGNSGISNESKREVPTLFNLNGGKGRPRGERPPRKRNK